MAKKLPNIQFRWIGGRPFGAMTEGIKRLDEKIGTAPSNIKFSGLFSLKDMPALYAAADAFIFLSYQENSPLAPIEAAASGMPVMYRNLREYELLYKNEYLSGTTHDDFVKWIAEISTNSSQYATALAVSKKLITQFEKESIRRQLISLYKDIVEGSTSARSKRFTVSLERM
jgi:1,2-diacylglycerol-3-alpha-glucose alpha-1,2-galactosyltransferase